MNNNTFQPGAGRALFFSTSAFAVSFAVWGLIAALARPSRSFTIFLPLKKVCSSPFRFCSVHSAD
jgi:hypothetical protein